MTEYAAKVTKKVVRVLMNLLLLRPPLGAVDFKSRGDTTVSVWARGKRQGERAFGLRGVLVTTCEFWFVEVLWCYALKVSNKAPWTPMMIGEGSRGV